MLIYILFERRLFKQIIFFAILLWFANKTLLFPLWTYFLVSFQLFGFDCLILWQFGNAA